MSVLGNPIVLSGGGTSGAMAPHTVDLDSGYVANGTWYYKPGDPAYADVYAVEAGKHYFVSLGNVVGNRFRVMFSARDPSTATADMTGTRVGTDTSNPAQYANVVYSAASAGYLTIGKTSEGQAGIKTYVFNMEELCS